MSTQNEELAKKAAEKVAQEFFDKGVGVVLEYVGSRYAFEFYSFQVGDVKGVLNVANNQVNLIVRCDLTAGEGRAFEMDQFSRLIETQLGE